MPAFVLEIADATKHMEAEGKKNLRYVASNFRPHIERIEGQQCWKDDYLMEQVTFKKEVVFFWQRIPGQLSFMAQNK
jgi:hypothetical protein